MTHFLSVSVTGLIIENLENTETFIKLLPDRNSDMLSYKI